MFFSVVIPLYNKSPYIARAVNSVLNQTFQDFEIIVVDDGSTDGGGEIAKNYPDSRIRYIYQENAGVSAARNQGVEKAKFEYIAFLDADDEWDNNCLEIFEHLIGKFVNYSFFGQSFRVVDALEGTHLPHSLCNIPLNWEGVLTNYLEMASIDPPFSSSSVCIRKSVIQEIGGFPGGVRLGEDLSLWFVLSFRYPIVFKHSVSATYYRNAIGNTFNTLTPEFGYFEKLLEKYFNNHQFDSKTRNEIYEYYASRLLMHSSYILKLGNHSQCQALLNLCKKTKRFKFHWVKLWILSMLPHRTAMAVLKAKQIIRKVLLNR